MDAPPPLPPPLTPAERIEEAARTNATELSLAGLGLTELPHGVTDLLALEELDLAENRLTTLPASIGNLRNLKVLFLQDNQLTALPPELGDLFNLRTLHLDRNRLTTLPPELSRLPRWALTLTENPLVDPPPNIRGIDAMMAGLHQKLIATAPLSVRTTPEQYTRIVRALIDDGGTQIEMRESGAVILTRNTRVTIDYDADPPTTSFRAARDEVIDYLRAFLARNPDLLR